MKKNWIKIAVTIVLAGVAYYQVSDYFDYNNSLANALSPQSQEKIIVLIQKGSSARKIGNILQEKKIIRKGKNFERYVKSRKAEQKLLSGRFEVSPGMTIPEITEVLTNPKKAKNFITVPEGWTVTQIDDALVKMGIIKPEEFSQAAKNFQTYEKFPFLQKEKLQTRQQPLEGYLFPDTYFLDTGAFNAQTLIDQMLRNFQKKITAEKISADALDNTILIASLLEREVRTEKDLAIVAGIIWKRNESGWFLNIDATTLYDKDYDTYKIKGFPPGPIGNPGMKTIHAAANPVGSPYWYYITKPKTGEVVYAKTNDEQNQNRAKYLN